MDVNFQGYLACKDDQTFILDDELMSITKKVAIARPLRYGESEESWAEVLRQLKEGYRKPETRSSLSNRSTAALRSRRYMPERQFNGSTVQKVQRHENKNSVSVV